MLPIFQHATGFLAKGLAKGGKTGKDTLAYLCSKFSTRILTLLLLPVWTAYLSPAQYGTIGTLGAWIGVLTPIVLLGLPGALVRFCPDRLCNAEERHRFLSTAGIMVGLAGLTTLVATFTVGPWLWELISSGKIPFYPLVPLGVCGMVLATTSRLVLAERLAVRDTRQVIWIEQLTSTGSILAALFGVAVLGWGVLGHLLGGVLMSGVTCIFLLRRYQVSGVKWDPGIAKKCFIYGVPLVPQALAAWALNLSDRVIIERYHPLDEAGYYSLAANFGMIMSFIAVSIAQSTTPVVFAAMAESTEENQKRIRLASVFTLGIIGVCAIGMMSLAPPLVAWIANPRYLVATQYLVPVVGGFFLFGVYQMFLRPMLYLGQTKIVGTFTVIAAVLNIVLNLIFVPSGGAMAAALTTAVSYFVAAVMSWWLSRRLDDMGVGWVAVALLIAIPLGCGFLLHGLPSSSWEGLLQRVGAGAIGVVLVVVVCAIQLKVPLRESESS